jgi:hypothetical protein
MRHALASSTHARVSCPCECKKPTAHVASATRSAKEATGACITHRMLLQLVLQTFKEGECVRGGTCVSRASARVCHARVRAFAQPPAHAAGQCPDTPAAQQRAGRCGHACARRRHAGAAWRRGRRKWRTCTRGAPPPRAPANPPITPVPMRRTFFTLGFTTSAPMVTCPSPIITTWARAAQKDRRVRVSVQRRARAGRCASASC